MNKELIVLKNSRLFNEFRIFFLVPLAELCITHYAKSIGSLLGGTKWIVFVLRRFGSQIGDDVILEEMNCLEDVHLITIGSHVRFSSTSLAQCHTFEHRDLKLRPVTINSFSIFKPMSLVLPGAVFMGHNRIMPCSVVMPHDQLAIYTDWSGSPIKRITVHHGLEPPQLILAQRRSSLGNYDVIVGRYSDDVLSMYFGENGWLGWQTAINLRRPFYPSDTYIKLFLNSFLCVSQVNRILIIGLGGGILPILIRHYFPNIFIDVVEIDETVIELAADYFGLAEEMREGHLQVISDDAFHYVDTTTQQYDIIFMDTFTEVDMPIHLTTEDFFSQMRKILNPHGCLATNANLSTAESFFRLKQSLSTVFQFGILLAYNSILENARVIISGSHEALESIMSKERAIKEAQKFESKMHLEFSLSQLISLAYQGSLIKVT